MDFENMIRQKIENFCEELQNRVLYQHTLKTKIETRVMKWELMKVGT